MVTSTKADSDFNNIFFKTMKQINPNIMMMSFSHIQVVVFVNDIERIFRKKINVKYKADNKKNEALQMVFYRHL